MGKLVLRNIVVNYLYMLTAFISQLILTPIVLHHLGQSLYGVWAVFNSLVTYFILVDFGMNTAVAKYTAGYRTSNEQGEINKLVSTAIVVICLLGIVLVSVSISISSLIPKVLNVPTDLQKIAQTAFVITALNVALMLLGGVFGNTLYGYQRIDIWKILGIIQLVSTAFSTLIFLQAGFGLVGVVCASTVSALIGLLIYLLLPYWRQQGVRFHPRYACIPTFKKVVPYSLRTFILSLTSRILYYTDYIVIGIFLGPALVTPYEIGYKLCFLTTYLFSVFSTVMFPKFSGLHELGDINSLRNLYLKIAKLSLLIIMPFSLFFIFFGQSFINVWVGPNIFPGMSVFVTLIVMNFFHALGTPSCMVLQSTGKNKGIVYSESINAALNLALSLILVRKIGLLGVALSTVVAHLLTSFWVIVLLTCRSLQLKIGTYIRASILAPAGTGLITGGILWFFSDRMFPSTSLFPLALNGIVIFLLYASVYWVLASTREERRLGIELLSGKLFFLKAHELS